MIELISGKEAFNYAFDGVDVEYQVEGDFNWCYFNDESWSIDEIKSKGFIFRLKPKTITLNGIEVPAPFEPMHSEKYFYLNLQRECLYAAKEFNGNHSDNSAVELGAWHTEDEIKQVVAALRKIFVINNQ